METIVIEKGKGKNEAFDNVKWLVRALSHDETRGTLQYVMVQGKRAVACDGYRMHIANVKDVPIESGIYKLLANTAKQIVLQKEDEKKLSPYPNVRAIVPRHAGKSVSLPWGAWAKSTFSCQVAKVVRLLPENLTINLSYLENCLTDDAWKVYPSKTGNGPMYFKNCTRSAVIMPFRMN